MFVSPAFLMPVLKKKDAGQLKLFLRVGRAGCYGPLIVVESVTLSASKSAALHLQGIN